MTPKPDKLKVLFLCSGVGIMNRGIESFFREAFDALEHMPDVEIHLLRGGTGRDGPHEHKGFCLPRTGGTAKLLAKLVNRDPYVIEQLSLIPSSLKLLRKYRFDIVYYSDCNILMRLYPWSHKLGLPFRALYSNGAPLHPPFDGTDFVQQVVPEFYNEAIQYGEPPNKHALVPYGISVPAGDPVFDPALRTELRRKLNLPLDRPILLSVGWISEYHKRMHHVIDEVARIPKAQRPFVMLLGAIDDRSPPIFARAADKLGEGNYAIRSVPYGEVADYYRTADLFTLCSLVEGFGRVYIEALMHGLPSIAHKHPIMQYVMDTAGTYVDMEAPGELSDAIVKQLGIPLAAPEMSMRRESVRSRFSWPVLLPAYRQMFFQAAGRTPPN